MLGLPSTLKLTLLKDLAAPVLALVLVASATPSAAAPDAATTADVAALEASAVEVAHELRAVPAHRTDWHARRTAEQIGARLRAGAAPTAGRAAVAERY